MTGVILIFCFVLIGTIALYRILDRRIRRSDVDSIRSRLAGDARADKSGKRGKQQPTLIQTEERRRTLATRLLEHFRLGPHLQRLFERAGVRWTVARFGNMTVGAALGGGFLAWFLLPSPLNGAAVPIGLVAGTLPLLYLLRTASRRLHKFEEQFPDSLEFVSRSMRAGHAFSVSLEMLHKEFEEPLSGEFRRTFDEQNLGLPLDVTLEKLSERMPLMDVQFFVSAVLLQKRTGGNLAEVLDKLAVLIRERFKLRGRIRAISAHGRMTGTVLSLIPLTVGLLMFWTNRDYIMFFFHDPTGHWMLGGSIALQLIGYGIIRKIVQIEI